MTEEQIKQKAYEYWIKGTSFALEDFSIVIQQAYIAGATETTKELQEENEKLQKDLYVALNNFADGYQCSLSIAKEIIRELLKYIFTPEGFEVLDKDMIMKAEAFLNKE